MVDEKDKEQRIRERAHKIWLEEGQFPDSEQANWEKAKREIEEEDRKAVDGESR